MSVMRRTIAVLWLGGLALPAAAQQQEEVVPESYIYATYYQCDLNRQEEADAVITQDIAPLYDRAVSAGAITGWGWLSHHTGGPWRRLFYYTADSVDALLNAQASLAEQRDPGANERFNAACGTHDDYIWRRVAGGGEAESRGAVSLSTYHVCDISREDRADEIFEAVLTPVYDSLVDDGVLQSWGWNEHVVGGQYRRLDTMAAEDWTQIFRAVDVYVAAVTASELGRELSEICDSHSDYLWNVELETP